MRIVTVAVAGLLMLAVPFTAHGQSACDDALREAQKSYDLGLFEDVPGQLGPCLGAPMSRRTAVQVHSLLARAYLNSDEPAKARKEVSAILRLDSTFEAGVSSQFAALVSQVRREELTTQVASVSKTNESLREAPATVVVVTGDEIQRRGYLDLEQLLYDVPGFDISRSNEAIYSYIYQRGYRSPLNDRLIFLVDGVEQNELSTNILYLSRQFPLSNIDRVEVVYGPASTMYGANAYTGVISIITKDPEALVEEKKAFALTGRVTTGERAHFADITAAGKDRSGTVAWSVAANLQQSTERNLSGREYWDYGYNDIDYRSAMHLTGMPEERAALCATPSPYIRCSDAGIDLTDAGEALVRRLDAALIPAAGVGFHDTAKNWSINAKLRLANLTIGLQSWRSQEGIGSATRAALIGGSSDWTPRGSALYLKYSLPLERMKVNVFTRYLLSSQERATSEFDYLHNYASGFLSLWSLVPPCQAPLDPVPVQCAPATPWVEEVHFASLSSQLRSEINATFETSEKWSGVAGVELAKSSIQTTYAQFPSGPGALSTPGIPSPEHVEHTDVGLYAQGAYKLRPALKLVLAGRLSRNEINNKPGARGFGTLFTPRAALIYSPPRTGVVLKAIYSEAFKDPTDSQKFGTVRFINEFPSLGLKLETVKNVELSAGWEPSRGTALEATLYDARYSNVVSFEAVPDCTAFFGCLRYANRDSIRVRGAQLTARRRQGRADLWANYTWTDSKQTNPKDPFGAPLVDDSGNVVKSLRTADIASHNASAGVDVEWSERLRGAVGLHHSGVRPTGPGTTQPDSPLSRVDAYTTAQVAVTYFHPRSNVSLQLGIQNLFDRVYYAPSVQPVFGAPRVPYGGRSIYLRLLYGRLPEHSP
jgi:outer membrane receptor protein involved in Fe transport